MTVLRSADETDIPLLQNLAREIWVKHYTGIISSDQIDFMLGKMYNAETIGSELKQGIQWKIVEKGKEPIGFYSFSMIKPTQCKLYKIYLKVEFHGLGIGKTCLNDVVAYAKSQKAGEVILYVNRNNLKGFRAYKAYGFTVQKEVDTDFGNGYVLNDYKMSLAL
ncbi:MAG: GNAT family N-acetyltransferase [Victivallales bacterium]|jgi:ribosomal protein S18 acetylase RimI-like enzyme